MKGELSPGECFDLRDEEINAGKGLIGISKYDSAGMSKQKEYAEITFRIIWAKPF